MENRHVPTCSSHNRVTKFSISPIPEARPQVLLKNRIGCYTAEVIIDIATISGKFTWNFVDMVQLISKLSSTPQISRSRFIIVFSACKDGFLKFGRQIFYIG
jgi:hypothetical protein